MKNMKDGILDRCIAQGWNCPKQEKKPTNADRIRSMSDEELAEFIFSQVQAKCSNNDCVGADTCYYHADWNDKCADGCEQAIKRWLQSEAGV